MSDKKMKISWKDKRIWLWFGLMLAVFAAALRHMEDVRDGAVESGDYWLLSDYRNLFIGVLIVIALCQISPRGIHRSSGTKTESLFCL